MMKNLLVFFNLRKCFQLRMKMYLCFFSQKKKKKEKVSYEILETSFGIPLYRKTNRLINSLRNKIILRGVNY